MAFDPHRHHRQSLRLEGYDYSQAGAYFLTICTHQGECLFGKIAKSEMQLDAAGQRIVESWEELPRRFPGVALDGFVVMPNHVHGIILLSEPPAIAPIEHDTGEPCVRPPFYEAEYGAGRTQDAGRTHGSPVQGQDSPGGTLTGTVGRIVQAFKSITTRSYSLGVQQHRWPAFDGKLWHRNYHDHIIRDEEALGNIRQYIEENPSRWADDKNNPANNQAQNDTRRR